MAFFYSFILYSFLPRNDLVVELRMMNEITEAGNEIRKNDR